MVLGMDEENRIRQRIKELMAAKKKTEHDVGRHLGIRQQSVNDYLSGDTKHWPVDRIKKCEEFLGDWILQDPDELASAASTDLEYVHTYGKKRPAPVVDMRRAPLGAEAGKMAEILAGSTKERYETHSQDPGAFGLRLTKSEEQLDDFRVGDIATVSPAGIKQLRHKSYVAIVSGDEIRIAKHKLLQGEPGGFIIEIGDEQIEPDRLLGKIVEKYTFYP